MYLLAMAILLPASLHAQKPKKTNFGKEFYVAFAENHGGSEAENFFALFITGRVATSGKVEVPAIGFSQTFTTTPGKITTVQLPNGDNGQTVELTAGNNQEEVIVKGMAVHVTSNDDIAVYGMSHKLYSSDAFMALPVGVLGTEYRTMNYQTSDPGFFGDVTPGEFWIVAVADSTNITITPKAATRQGVPPGSTIKRLLYKGDIYLVQGDPTDDQNDLTGSLIESDQAIAVLSGHVRTQIPFNAQNANSGGSTSRDHLVEQLPPVSAWGDSALVVRYQSATLPDLIRVVSSEDGNVISVNGSVVKTLNAGDFYEITSLNGPKSIQGTSPILVGQYMHTSQYGTTGNRPAYGDPAYSLIFPVEQFDSSYTFMFDENPTFDGNFINIIADPTGVASMMLDGKSITGPPYSATFQAIPGSGYVYTQVSFKSSQQGAHNIYSTQPFGVTVYAMGNVDSYAYPGGSALKTITPFKTVDLLIDFGDRIMTNTAVAPAVKYDTSIKIGTNKWDTTVYLQNISSDPYQIDGFTNRGGNGQTDFDVNRFPASIAPSAFDSITIEFNTDQPYVELNTTIQAKTPHLQAYVVQVKGRGILVNAQIYSDSTARLPIDTLDFGVFDAATDPPKDSFVYIANKGTTDLTIDSDFITGPNVADFTYSPAAIAPFPRTIKSKPVTPPYVLHPYSNVLALADSSAKVRLRFSPTLLPNGFYQAEYDIRTNGQQRKVILLAQVKTILQSTVSATSFDTAYLCEQETRSIFVNNPNPFAITVTNVNIGGLDSLDFSLITQIPLVIPPNSQGEIQLTFAPTDTTGMRTGTATLSFNLPKGFSKTLPLSAYGGQLSSNFWARTNIHILPGESTLFPIYARAPMDPFNSPSLELDVWYDSSHLQDDPYSLIQDNTLTANGYWNFISDSIGYTAYTYVNPHGNITGGSDTTQAPLVYLSFKSNYLPGDDPLKFHQDVDIYYRVIFPGSPINQGCILSLAPSGRISLDSTCENVYLLLDTLLYPTDSYMEPIKPNPASDHVRFIFDVPAGSSTTNTQPRAAGVSGEITQQQEIPVRIDIIDMNGNAIATAVQAEMKPGTYQIVYNTTAIKPGMYIVALKAAGKVKTRQLVIMK
jgi:hypothetical protein